MDHAYRSENFCCICGAQQVWKFLEINQVPIHCNLLWPGYSEARQAQKGEIHLGFCENCGHIYNLAYNPELMNYTQQYENSLHFSPHFQGYITDLARRLVDRYSLIGRDIIEIGSGKGDFLRLLVELGKNRGVGFDPSYEALPGENERNPSIQFVQDFYSEKFAHYQADLVCFRHTLEHIESPKSFLDMLRRTIAAGTNTIVFCEVPNVRYTLCNLGIWDLIYEHISYFSDHSLAYLFQAAGFEILDVADTYAGQFLYLESKLSRMRDANHRHASGSDSLSQLRQYVIAFSDNYAQKVAVWQQRLEQIRKSGKRAALWGAGSKGVSFLNTFQVQEEIPIVVDLNPRKTGMFVAGTGQKITAPEFLRTYQPDIIIIMNPVYEQEIVQSLESLSVSAEILLA